MGSRYYSPNSSQNDNSPSGFSNNRTRGRPYNSPNWRSPPWNGQNLGGSPGYYQPPQNFSDGPRRGGWKNDNKPWRGSHNSNSPSFHTNKNFSQTSSPRGSQRLSYSGQASSGFIPLPASRNFPRHHSPYSRGNSRPYRGNNKSFGQRQRSSLSDQPIENYFKQTMLENPWAVFIKQPAGSVTKHSPKAHHEIPDVVASKS